MGFIFERLPRQRTKFSIVPTGIQVIRSRKLKRTTDSDHALKIAPNLLQQDLALRALNMAMAIRRPPPGCVHRTGCGSQFCAHDCRKLLRKDGFKVSMSGRGNFYDNSAIESIFKSPKAELVWHRNRQTRREVEIALFA